MHPGPIGRDGLGLKASLVDADQKRPYRLCRCGR
jgi:hypothetical protein